MSLSTVALVTLVQAKNYLRVDAAASLHIDAEYVGVGDDGVEGTKEFTLDHTPVEGSLKLYLKNVLQVEPTHFSIADATITFVTAPPDGDIITASYDYAAADNTFEAYDDELLERLIEAATKKAEDYTGRVFVQGSITEKHFGDGTKVLKLYKQPVVSITSVVREISEIVGTGDGATVEFILKETPTLLSVTVYVDGVLQTLTTHYTISGSTITFVAESTPTDGAKITAEYTHTILPISEYTEWLSIGRLKTENLWTANRTFKVVYIAGYGADRAATQALVPDAVAAVLLILANLFENRTDQVKSESVAGLGSVTYDIPSQAKELLNPLRVNVL